MKYTYTAVFTQEEEGFNVNFPDFQGCYTCGDDMADAIHMAHDVLCLTLCDLEDDKKPVPSASKQRDIQVTGEQITSVIAVDTGDYRRFCEERVVKKTLTIPGWLNERAEHAGINFSGVLQEAIKERLNIQG